MVNLIEDILDYSRIQFDKFEKQLTNFSLSDIVKEVYDIVEFQATEKGLNLRVELGTDQIITILTDKKRLKQIILNLVSNAIKFTFNGQITVKISYKNHKP